MATPDSTLSSINASFSFSDIVPSDWATVSQSVWRTLLFISGSEQSSKFAVSLTFYHSTHRAVSRTVWVAPPQTSSCASVKYDIVISRQLRYELCLSSDISTCSIAVIAPVYLTDVTMIASTDPSYSSVGRLSEIERFIYNGDRLLNANAILDGMNSEQRPEHINRSTRRLCRLQVALTEPVQQGRVLKGKTRLVVTFDDSMSDTSTSDTMNTSSMGSDEKFVIDENFFARSVLRRFDNAPLKNLPQRSYDNGGDRFIGDFSLIPLPCCWLRDFPESYSMLVSTEHLGQLGIFSGDWCIASPDGASPRLVQINSMESSSLSALTEPSSGGKIYASPQLLCNFRLHPCRCDVASICASPFGAGPPTIPIARAVTLARVASPLSLDRSYASAMVTSLKQKLDACRCLVRSGDIISVTFPVDGALQIHGISSGASTDDENTEVHSRAGFECSLSSILVYFVVSSIECDRVTASNEPNNGFDWFSRATYGELGCWVDSSLTRVVQTGIEHLPVPTYRCDATAATSKLDHRDSNACFEKIHDLASAALEENAFTFGLDLLILLTGGTVPLMSASIDEVASRLGYHLLKTSAFDIVGETEGKTEAGLKERFEIAMASSPCIFVLRDIDGLIQTSHTDVYKEHTVAHAFRECAEKLEENWRQTGFPVLVLATSSNVERLSVPMLSCFKHQIVFEVPNESERSALLKSQVSDKYLAADVSIRELGVQTAAFTDDDLVDLVARMRLHATERSLRLIPTSSSQDILSIRKSGLLLSREDSSSAVEKARISFSKNIGTPSIPKVSWSDVGGLSNVKQEILDTIELPLENPSLFADGLKQRSGILLYGPPGTGKTLLAKAVATSFSLNFFSVKGPELLNMYIGESEANVRRVFQQARDAKPCVIFFDELDSIAPKRGNHGDSGGVMDRIVSQLLAELDGMSTSRAGADVFVIGATNRPDLLDPALLRPGRFDRLLYLGVCDTHEAQLNILEALTRKFRLDSQLDLMHIAEQSPLNYTGADFYALCSDAMLKAMARKAQLVEDAIRKMNDEPHLPNHQYPLTPQYYLGEIASPSETDIIVSREDFQEALRELVPSVSQAEMDHYTNIQKKFGKSFMNVRNEDFV